MASVPVQLSSQELSKATSHIPITLCCYYYLGSKVWENKKDSGGYKQESEKRI